MIIPHCLRSISSTKLVIITSLYFFLGLNFVLMERLYEILFATNGPGILFGITVPLFFLAAFVIISTPMISKFIAKPVLIFLLLTSSLVNYASFNLGVVFNHEMMVNIFETTGAEAATYLNAKVILWFLVTGILPALYVFFVKIEYKPLLKEIAYKVAFIGGAVALIFIIAVFYYKDYASIARNHARLHRNIVPIQYIVGSIKYTKEKFFTKSLPYTLVGKDSERIKEPEKYLTIVMVGETARAQNYELNGYSRATNAYTKYIKGLVSFQNVNSCGTATAVSLPCMFSFLGKDKFSQSQFDAQDNVVDVIHRAGVESVWIENNTGCKGVCKSIRTYTNESVKELNCKVEECKDETFLTLIDKEVASFKGNDGVIFLHVIGSHGPTYYQRYPKEFAKFKPDCQTSDLQKCTKEQIVNSYDNTILYTDYVMAELIKKLGTYEKNYNTSLIYMSDHGESLGENGLYLHGMAYALAPAYQTHVPFILWLSEKMIKHKKIDQNCLANNAKTKPYSHDNLPHTLLGLLDVETLAHDKTKDVLALCSKENLPN